MCMRQVLREILVLKGEIKRERFFMVIGPTTLGVHAYSSSDHGMLWFHWWSDITLNLYIYLLACKIAMIRENRKMIID